jgi:hypothetical protein
MNVPRKRLVSLIMVCLAGSALGFEAPTVVTFGGGATIVFTLALAAGISTFWSP